MLACVYTGANLLVDEILRRLSCGLANRGAWVRFPSPAPVLRFNSAIPKKVRPFSVNSGAPISQFARTGANVPTGFGLPSGKKPLLPLASLKIVGPNTPTCDNFTLNKLLRMIDFEKILCQT